MLLGPDVVDVYRKGKPNRDGDSEYQKVGHVTNVSLQVEGLRGTEFTVRSDGIRRNATDADATLYLLSGGDVRRGDRVVRRIDGTSYYVTTDPIVHIYPDGRTAGSKCFMDRVESW